MKLTSCWDYGILKSKCLSYSFEANISVLIILFVTNHIVTRFSLNTLVDEILPVTRSCVRKKKDKSIFS